jgi:hypothetical protein
MPAHSLLAPLGVSHHRYILRAGRFFSSPHWSFGSFNLKRDSRLSPSKVIVVPKASSASKIGLCTTGLFHSTVQVAAVALFK